MFAMEESSKGIILFVYCDLVYFVCFEEQMRKSEVEDIKSCGHGDSLRMDVFKQRHLVVGYANN